MNNRKLIIISIIILVIGIVIGYEIGVESTKNKIENAINNVFNGESENDSISSKGTSKSNQNTKKASKDKIELEAIGLTEAGDFVVKVTNNNDVEVGLSDIVVNFMDENGNFALTKNAQQSFIKLSAQKTAYVYVWGFGEDFSKYPTYELSCEIANIADSFVADGVSITSNNTGTQIAVTLQNDSEYSITSAKVVVLYYKDGIIVGAEEGYSSTTTSVGNNVYVNVEYPEDANYDAIDFDTYEAYFLGASKTN